MEKKLARLAKIVRRDLSVGFKSSGLMIRKNMSGIVSDASLLKPSQGFRTIGLKYKGRGPDRTEVPVPSAGLGNEISVNGIFLFYFSVTLINDRLNTYEGLDDLTLRMNFYLFLTIVA